MAACPCAQVEQRDALQQRDGARHAGAPRHNKLGAAHDRIVVQLHAVVAGIGGHDREPFAPRVAGKAAHLWLGLGLGLGLGLEVDHRRG